MKVVKLSDKKILRADSNQYIKNCDTEKAYALTYSKYSSNMLFLSKKHTEYKFEESTDSHWFIFPNWLYEKLSYRDKAEFKAFDDDELDRICEEDNAKHNPYKNETCPIIKPY